MLCPLPKEQDLWKASLQAVLADKDLKQFLGIGCAELFETFGAKTCV